MQARHDIGEATILKVSKKKNLFKLPKHVLQYVLPACGVFLALLAITEFGDLTQMTLLITPFGASTIIMFSCHGSPFAKPRNLFGGYILSSLVGVMTMKLVGLHPWSVSFAVALSIYLMLVTDTLHPPAGAATVYVMVTDAGWLFIVSPLLIGCALLFLVALVYLRAIGINYPSESKSCAGASRHRRS